MTQGRSSKSQSTQTVDTRGVVKVVVSGRARVRMVGVAEVRVRGVEVRGEGETVDHLRSRVIMAGVDS